MLVWLGRSVLNRLEELSLVVSSDRGGWTRCCIVKGHFQWYANELVLTGRSIYWVLVIYKTFARPHLDYGDVIYEKVFNQSFHKKLESVQYNAALAMTGAILETNTTKKLYQELGLESLQNRRKLRSLCLFYKIYKHHTQPYLHNLIPKLFKVPIP